MATLRDALTARIRKARERKDSLQLQVNAANSEIADLIAQRDALSSNVETQVAEWQRIGVIRIED